MCSVCYKSTHMNKPQESPASSAVVPSPEPVATMVTQEAAPSPAAIASTSEPVGVPESASDAPDASAAGAANPPEENDEPKKQANPNRCYSCNKRVGLTGFECRCGFTYCATHRHANKHACQFDFKQMGRDAVAKANPTVMAEKVDKVRWQVFKVLTTLHAVQYLSRRNSHNLGPQSLTQPPRPSQI